MVQKMANKMAKKMSEHSVIEAKSIHIYAYGLELLFSSVSGVIALIVISAVCEKPFLWIPYLAGFIPIRLSGGGYHTKTHFRCIFTFSLLYSLALLMERMCTLSLEVWLFSCLVNLFITFLFSPVTAPNKQLKEYQRRANRRNSLIISLINLFGCVALLSMFASKSQWVNMYFAGSGLAGLSMLLAVIKKQKRRKHHEKNS